MPDGTQGPGDWDHTCASWLGQLCMFVVWNPATYLYNFIYLVLYLSTYLSILSCPVLSYPTLPYPALPYPYPIYCPWSVIFVAHEMCMYLPNIPNLFSHVCWLNAQFGVNALAKSTAQHPRTKLNTCRINGSTFQPPCFDYLHSSLFLNIVTGSTLEG
jgi:hypothetical protein